MTESTSIPNQKSSSWFSNFTLSPNLTNQLNNLSTSILQATNKVGNVATTLVQKSMPQRPSTPPPEDEQTTRPNKDFTSIWNDLSSSVMKSAQQIKQAVEEKSILGNFTKEHDKFVTDKRTQQAREQAAILPWAGYQEEEEMKKQILALSKETRNFLRSPPPGADYHFDMTSAYPVALAILEVDENLTKMRFDLVPKQINEESFWQNYFYRVSLIKQSTQLTALANENANTQSVTHSVDDARRTSDLHETLSDVSPEFVSEDFDTSAVSMDDIRREIEQLSLPKKHSNKTKSGSSDLDESEWDKALADELENVSAEELEAQINQMLADDTK